MNIYNQLACIKVYLQYIFVKYSIDALNSLPIEVAQGGLLSYHFWV